MPGGEIDPWLWRIGGETARDGEIAAVIGQRLESGKGVAAVMMSRSVADACARRLPDRGGGRLSRASLSRDPASRHLDGRVARLAGGAAQPSAASFARRRAAGVLALALYLAPVAALACAVVWIAPRGLVGFAALALIAASLPAQRSLDEHVRAVALALERGGLAAGREAVSRIVGRNVATLDEAGVARAALESLAENFSDGIVAPLFWLALGGLPGGALYKAINTADSMIGHRNERYLAFGWAAARLDDLVNLPASRLAALWLLLAAALTPGARPAEALARDPARRAHAPLAQRRLARGGDGGRAGAEARGPARLRRDAGRRRLHGRGPRRGDGGGHPARR